MIVRIQQLEKSILRPNNRLIKRNIINIWNQIDIIIQFLIDYCKKTKILHNKVFL
jgi:hypothetical protein